MENKNDKDRLYKFSFHESRFPIIEQHLSPEKAKKFRELSNEDKALFVNYLIEIGVLSW